MVVVTQCCTDHHLLEVTQCHTYRKLVLRVRTTYTIPTFHVNFLYSVYNYMYTTPSLLSPGVHSLPPYSMYIPVLSLQVHCCTPHTILNSVCKDTTRTLYYMPYSLQGMTKSTHKMPCRKATTMRVLEKYSPCSRGLHTALIQKRHLFDSRALRCRTFLHALLFFSYV